MDTPLDSALKTYLEVAYSFILGLERLWSAKSAFARLACALMEFHAPGQDRVEPSPVDVLEHLAKIDYRSYDSWSYVSNVSHLVYATTLLDTFFSDTTLFLFLLIPQSMGKNQQVPLRTIIDSSSRNDALTQAAMNRTREISYLAFSARLEFLEQTFGLKIALRPDAAEALNHFPSIRNTAVHNQGIYDLRLDENGKVTATQKSCARHPTQVSWDDVFKAIKAYEEIVFTIAETVFCQVLKQQDDPEVKRFLGIRHLPASR